MNFTIVPKYHNHRRTVSKGIKSPSKLLSPKYLSQSSLIKQNENLSSPKHVHFINSIVILNKEGEAKAESSMEACKAEFINHEMSEGTKEVKSEEEVEEETKDEAEEKEKERNLKHFDTFPTMNELKYHEWLLKILGLHSVNEMERHQASNGLVHRSSWKIFQKSDYRSVSMLHLGSLARSRWRISHILWLAYGMFVLEVSAHRADAITTYYACFNSEPDRSQLAVESHDDAGDFLASKVLERESKLSDIEIHSKADVCWNIEISLREFYRSFPGERIEQRNECKDASKIGCVNRQYLRKDFIVLRLDRRREN
ncbi:hypothetical protein Tco_0071263 [Tanacetum coccineum]